MSRTEPLHPTDAPPGLKHILRPGWRSPLRRVDSRGGEVQRLSGEVLARADAGHPLGRALAWSGAGVALSWGASLAWEALLRHLPIASFSDSETLAFLGPLGVAVLFAAWRFSRLTAPSWSKEELEQTARARDPLRRVQADEQAQLLAHLNAIPGFEVGSDSLLWGLKRLRWAASLERSDVPSPAAWVFLETDADGDALEIGLLHQERGAASALQSLCQRPALHALLGQLAADADRARWQEQPHPDVPDGAVVWLRLRLRDLHSARLAALERRSSGEAAAPAASVELREDPAVAVATLVALALRAGLGVDRSGGAAGEAQLRLRRAASAPTPAPPPRAARWTLRREGALPPPWEPPNTQEALQAAQTHRERQARSYGSGILVGLGLGLVALLVFGGVLEGGEGAAALLQSLTFLWLGGLFLLMELPLALVGASGLPPAVRLGRAEAGETTLEWDGVCRLSCAAARVSFDLERPFQLQLSRAPAPDGAASTHLGVTLLQQGEEGTQQRFALEVPGLALDEDALQLPVLALDAPRCSPRLWTDTLGPLLEGPLAAHGAAAAWTARFTPE